VLAGVEVGALVAHHRISLALEGLAEAETEPLVRELLQRLTLAVVAVVVVLAQTEGSMARLVVQAS
jgi:hypothetical protein